MTTGPLGFLDVTKPDLGVGELRMALLRKPPSPWGRKALRRGGAEALPGRQMRVVQSHTPRAEGD